MLAAMLSRMSLATGLMWERKKRVPGCSQESSSSSATPSVPMKSSMQLT